MTLFTSVADGNWNDEATWDGTGYPNAADDDVAIGHKVTWDRGVDTIAFDAITVNSGGMLVFPVTSSWTLLFGTTGILTINSGGEIRTGNTSSADYLGAAYLGQIHWAQGSIARNVMVLNDGGKINLYGADIYDPNERYAYLDSDWSSGSSTLYITGDYTSKWSANQYFYIHDNLTAYQTNGYQIQGDIYKISSVGSYDSGNDRTPINTTTTCVRSCTALNATTGNQSKLILITRNLKLGDPNNANQYVVANIYTKRIRFDNNQGVNNTLVYFKNCLFFCWDNCCDGGYNINYENVCFVSNNNVIYTGTNNEVTGDFVSNGIGIHTGINHQITGDFVANGTGIHTGTNHQVTGNFVSNGTGIYTGINHQVTGDFVSNNIGINAGTNNGITGDFVSNNNGIYNGINHQITGNFVSNNIGINAGTNHQITGNFVSNGTGLTAGINNEITGDFSNNTTVAGSIVSNTVLNSVIMEDCTFADINRRPFRCYSNSGTIISCTSDDIGSWQEPTSGSSYIFEVTPNSYCDTSYIDKILLSPLNNMACIAPASETTLTLKIYPIGWTSSLTSDDVILEAGYLDSESGITRTTVYNTSQTYENSAWRNCSITFTPGQVGVVYFQLYLTKYESGCTILIDPEWVIS